MTLTDKNLYIANRKLAVEIVPSKVKELVLRVNTPSIQKAVNSNVKQIFKAADKLVTNNNYCIMIY